MNHAQKWRHGNDRVSCLRHCPSGVQWGWWRLYMRQWHIIATWPCCNIIHYWYYIPTTHQWKPCGVVIYIHVYVVVSHRSSYMYDPHTKILQPVSFEGRKTRRGWPKNKINAQNLMIIVYNFTIIIVIVSCYNNVITVVVIHGLSSSVYTTHTGKPLRRCFLSHAGTMRHALSLLVIAIANIAFSQPSTSTGEWIKIHTCIQASAAVH